MSTPETPRDIPRPLFARRPEIAPAPAPAAEAEEPFQPRYVHVHALREHGHGPRNLAWGVVTLFLAVILVAIGLFIAGPRALVALAVCLLTFTALFVLARMHIFRQRNGGFLGLGIVCLFGAAVPLVERGYVAMDTFVKSRPVAPTPIVATVLNGASLSDEAPLSLTEAFALPAPDPKAGPRVAVRKDLRVAIEGKLYVAKAGDLFALAGKNGRDVNIAVRDLLVTLPADSVEILDGRQSAAASRAAVETASTAKSAQSTQLAATPDSAPPVDETPDQATARSQREAIRRYPALGMKGSLENQMFVSLFNEIRDNGGDDFFKNPEWPVEIAEMLAKREHWSPGAPPMTTSSGPTISTDDASAPGR